MKRISCFLFWLLLLSRLFADISLTTDQPSYNLGNKIKASATDPNKTQNLKVFKMTLSCGTYKIQYFMTPVALKQILQPLNVPELPATASMMETAQ